MKSWSALVLTVCTLAFGAQVKAEDSRLIGCWKSTWIAIGTPDGRQVEDPKAKITTCARVYTVDQIDEICTNSESGKSIRAKYKWTTSGSDRSLLGSNPYMEILKSVDGVEKKGKPLEGVYSYSENKFANGFSIIDAKKDGSSKSYGFTQLNAPACAQLTSTLANGSKDVQISNSTQQKAATVTGSGPLSPAQLAKACGRYFQQALITGAALKTIDSVQYFPPVSAQAELGAMAPKGDVVPTLVIVTRHDDTRSRIKAYLKKDSFGDWSCLG